MTEKDPVCIFEHQKHLFQHGYSFKLHSSSKNQFYEYFTLMYSTRYIWKREFLTFNTKRPPSLSYSISDPNSYLSQRKVARDHTLNNFHAPLPYPLPLRLLKCLLSFHFVWVPELLDKILNISGKIQIEDWFVKNGYSLPHISKDQEYIWG